VCRTSSVHGVPGAGVGASVCGGRLVSPKLGSELGFLQPSVGQKWEAPHFDRLGLTKKSVNGVGFDLLTVRENKRA